MALSLQGKEKMWVHFTAVGGKGMGALAVLLADLGHHVTGSDGPLFAPMDAYISKSKVHFCPEYRAENLDGQTWGIAQKHPDLVIVGNAISRGHVEAAKVETLLAEGKVQRMSFSEALAEFAIKGHTSFVVSGTHGKSTTSSMLAWCFERIGKHPGFFIGAIPDNFQSSCRLGTGDVFVSEGDEYDTAYWDKVSKFLHYLPDWVVCTGVEFDHADIFPNLKAIENSFLALVSKTRKGWIMIEDQLAPEPSVTHRLELALKEQPHRCVRYGLSASCDVRVTDWRSIELQDGVGRVGTSFTVCYKGEVKTFLSSMIGRHNMLNALACVAVMVSSGAIEFTKIPSDIFTDYKGIAKRQQELFYSERGVLIDDFAHHPRAISETLEALKLRYPQRVVRAFFEPRSATSARNLLFDSFVTCFDAADEVYLVEATKQNVPVEQRLNVALLKEKIEARGPRVFHSKTIEGLSDDFSRRERVKPELVVLMSNGSFGGIAKRLRELMD